jgi:hypothetical protein
VIVKQDGPLQGYLPTSKIFLAFRVSLQILGLLVRREQVHSLGTYCTVVATVARRARADRINHCEARIVRPMWLRFALTI